MRTVDIEVKRVAERCNLQQFNDIAGKAAHFEQFERHKVYVKVDDDGFVAFFQGIYRGMQCLFRLNKAKVVFLRKME